MVENIEILGTCPICEKAITFHVNKDLLLSATKFPIPFRIQHCKRTLISYVDESFKCLGTQLFIDIYKEENNPEDSSIAQPINSQMISQLSPDTKMVYEINELKTDQIEKIPNLIEKHLLRVLLKKRDVSLAMLIEESMILEKALNRTIDKMMILNIIEKYIQKEFIVKHNLKLEEKANSSLIEMNNIERGNV